MARRRAQSRAGEARGSPSAFDSDQRHGHHLAILCPEPPLNRRASPVPDPYPGWGKPLGYSGCGPPITYDVFQKDAFGADWSKANDLIALNAKGSDGLYNIYTVKPDGSRRQQLAVGSLSFPQRTTGTPVWSPSGQFVAGARPPRLVMLRAGSASRRRSGAEPVPSPGAHASGLRWWRWPSPPRPGRR